MSDKPVIVKSEDGPTICQMGYVVRPAIGYFNKQTGLWTLHEKWVLETPTHIIEAEAGIDSDGKSIWELLQFLTGPRYSPEDFEAVLPHDLGYKCQLVERSLCDLWLYELTLVCGLVFGVEKIPTRWGRIKARLHNARIRSKANVLYWGVRKFGGVPWSLYTKTEVANYREYITIEEKIVPC
jgi:hypothetical protein